MGNLKKRRFNIGILSCVSNSGKIDFVEQCLHVLSRVSIINGFFFNISISPRS